jgi:hypothetical protein
MSVDPNTRLSIAVLEAGDEIERDCGCFTWRAAKA